jgi:hypothetical protein
MKIEKETKDGGMKLTCLPCGLVGCPAVEPAKSLSCKKRKRSVSDDGGKMAIV